MPSADRKRRYWLLGTLCLSLLALGGISISRHQAQQKAELAITLTGGDPSRAPWLVTRYGCGGCHTIAGIPGADGQVGPPLHALIERVYIGGSAPNTAENLVAWLVDPQQFSPRAAMPPAGLNQAEARDIAAYLYAH